MLEKSVEKKCCDYAAAKGVPNDKFVTPGKRGASDRIFWLVGGRPWVVEFKRPSGTTSKHQQLFAAKLKSLKYRVATIWDYDDFCYQLDEILSFGA